MIAIKLVNDQATLNNYSFEEIKEYVPGDVFSIRFQIFDPQTGNRIVPGTMATCTVVIQNSDGTFNTKTASMMFNPDDRSFWKVNLNSTDSTNLVGQNFKVLLDFLGDTTDIRTGMSYNSISKITFDGVC